MEDSIDELYIPEAEVELGGKDETVYAQRNVRRTRETRASQSREATSQTTQIDFSHFDKIFEMNNKGKTYMPEEATPPGYVGMWVRESVYGNSDYSNVNHRIRFGWLPPESSSYPKLGFVDIYGEQHEDSGLVRRGGLVWMLRPKELHDREMEYVNKKLKSSQHFTESSRRIGVEGGFVTGRGNNGQTVTFGSDAKSQYIAALFNH
jgi:hypothetical protein